MQPARKSNGNIGLSEFLGRLKATAFPSDSGNEAYRALEELHAANLRINAKELEETNLLGTVESYKSRYADACRLTGTHLQHISKISIANWNENDLTMSTRESMFSLRLRISKLEQELRDRLAQQKRDLEGLSRRLSST